jgi:hypothetical protein
MDEERLILQAKLEEVFPECGIFYNPPSNLLLEKPCIVYTLNKLDSTTANNLTYQTGALFQVTVLSNTPGLLDVDRMLKELPMSTHIRTFISEGIVNDIFRVRVKVI